MDHAAGSRLTVEREHAGEHAVLVSLAGRLDPGTVHQLTRAVMRQLLYDTVDPPVRLDLSDVVHCDPDSLHVLHGAVAVLEALGIDFTITHLSTTLHTAIDTAGLTAHLPLPRQPPPAGR
ncbi:hypothetical protein GCM10010129_76770 [Streptomyces fumigatiscleroticus]|nr:hypothetical protein GCM10010129_76770 [Streptomyces fumigatiscleroticus]